MGYYARRNYIIWQTGKNKGTLFNSFFIWSTFPFIRQTVNEAKEEQTQ